MIEWAPSSPRLYGSKISSRIYDGLEGENVPHGEEEHVDAERVGEGEGDGAEVEACVSVRATLSGILWKRVHGSSLAGEVGSLVVDGLGGLGGGPEVPVVDRRDPRLSFKSE